MKKTIFKIIIPIAFVVFVQSHTAFAARIYMEAPETAAPNASPVVIQVFVDNQADAISGVAGTFSFPTDLFTVQTISTQNGVVSLWAQQPHVSDQKYFDGRTRVTFEGIMPGGFTGVRSPYYEGTRPGLLFTIALTPLHAGEAEFLLDGTEIHAFNQTGSLLPSTDTSSHITIPTLTKTTFSTPSLPIKVTSTSLTTTLERSPLVNNNAWYLIVHEDEVIHTIDHIEVAETSEYDSDHVSEYEWHTVSIPYVLIYQARDKYIHTKVVYTNNTYATQTIAPVENSANVFPLSRILVCILLIGVLIFSYAKNFSHIRFTLRRARP